MAKTHDETGRKSPPISLELSPGTKELGPLIRARIPGDESLAGQVIDFHELVVEWISDHPDRGTTAFATEGEQLASAFEAAATALREAVRRHRGW
ncbi:hypothetical protein [Solimonas sp. SE-A11]|uniref:hypothetical protein n=1 Tax=Solimonas sp. SE-A11 TaxID=3054954 RepID=UPI00259CF634|nr:hypothetical protein [Solimonas sp. SE-A11]MDM4770855.1 hypothetical protein [Solimonas sp. SE-A11]